MRVMKWIGLLGLVAGLTAALQSTSRAALAQDQNLLANPSFEQPYESGKQASGWGRWFEDTGKPDDGSLNYVVGPIYSAELNPALIHHGNASQHVGNRYDPWHAGVKQAVVVPAGSPVRFCAYGRLFANNDDFEKTLSFSGINGRMQVGIFPNGEAEWNVGGIVWSPEANPHNGWQQLCVDATVGESGKVTVFVSSNYRGYAAYHLDAWWDNASLVVTAPPATAGPTQPAAPPVQQVPTVDASKCETRPDGTTVYTVQTGDTLFAIAIACDSTVDEIRRANNLATNIINVGQTLIVKGPTAPIAPTTTPAPIATQPPVEAPAATPTASAPQKAVPVATDGQICVDAFNDANANRARDDGEQLLGGVGFTLTDATGPRGSYVTSGLEPEPYCFAGLPPGAYTVDARSPAGVANTTELQWRIGLTAGMKFDVRYGGSRNATPEDSSVPSAANPTATPQVNPDAGSSGAGRIALGALGVAILLAAGFMANLIWTRSRR